MLGIPEITTGHPGIDRLGDDCRIAASVTVCRYGTSSEPLLVLGDRVSLYEGVRLVIGDAANPHARLQIGGDTIVNVYAYLSGEGGLEIGDQVLVGPHAMLLSAGHRLDGNTAPIRENPLTYGPVRIGRGAWIGAGAIVLEGVTVGEGAVVGAGAVVTRDVPPGAVVAGSPARILRFRSGRRPLRWRRWLAWR
ncbi:MAG TPA: acyltransferase [Sedimenticola sp.]|nr:acyltransferase [Sedimenticola sp.]